MKRLQSELAGKGIILKKLGYRRRSYVSVEQLHDLVSFMYRSNASSAAEVSRCTPIDLRHYLDSVSEHFRASRDKNLERKLVSNRRDIIDTSCSLDRHCIDVSF